MGAEISGKGKNPQTTDGRTVPDANELKLLASRQE
jgi:hypothetical protein